MSSPVRRISPNDWNALVASFPMAHILQTWEWGQSKVRNGWQPRYLVWVQGSQGLVCERWDVIFAPEAARALRSDLPSKNSAMHTNVLAVAMILRRTIPVGGFAARLGVLYSPRGPLLRDWADAGLRGRVLADLQAYARRDGAIFLKIDPDVRLGTGIPGQAGDRPDRTGLNFQQELVAAGWRFSDEQVQFRNTVLLDLSPSEDEILGRMKQKTRYNVRLAERKGVRIRPGTTADLGLLYRMYAETSLRDGFVIREEAYYNNLWGLFMRSQANPGAPTQPGNVDAAALQPQAEPLIAEVEGEAAAALVVFRFAGRAWYLFGMSSQAHREKMPNHLLQWEAMRRARAAGCREYDLWGAPDVFNESDSMWGVWRFKEGLGGEVVRHIGAWDYPSSRLFYPLYTRFLPQVLDVLRRRGRARTRQQMGA